jgi:hypothetical protein
VGWGDCGTDSRGRRIGYCYPARCDQKGCHVRIDRGLAYARGGMHGESETSCEGYFCGKHLAPSPLDDVRGQIARENGVSLYYPEARK